MDNILHLYDRQQVEKEASEWIIRFEGDTPITQEEIKAFQEWTRRSPVHRETIIAYSSLWSDMDLLSELAISAHKKRNAAPAASNKQSPWYSPIAWAGTTINAIKEMLSLKAHPIKSILLVSSVICAITLVSWQLYLTEHFPANGSYLTHTGERKTISLPDGSVIWLNTNSQLDVNYNNNARRIILFEGEAHFQVAKDQKKPFEVYAGTEMIKAVGTAFTVYKEADRLTVMVTEGKVNLFETQLPPSVDNSVSENRLTEYLSAIKANNVTQTIKPETQRKIRSLVAQQTISLPVGDNNTAAIKTIEHETMVKQLAWRDGLLIFAGEPLEEVVKEVCRYSNLNITIAETDLRSIRIGGQFRVGETDALFNVLETTFGLEVSILSDTQVEITRKH